MPFPSSEVCCGPLIFEMKEPSLRHSWDFISASHEPQLVVIRHPAHSCLDDLPQTTSSAAGFVKKSASSLPALAGALERRIHISQGLLSFIHSPIHSFNKYILSLYLLLTLCLVLQTPW